MTRLRPEEVYPHSKGKNRFVFQDIIINKDKYFFFLVDGKMKTNLYNKGVLDGTKKSIPLYSFQGDFSKELVTEKWLLAIPKEAVSSQSINERKHLFIGRIGVVKTYILKISAIGNFLENVCSLGECPYMGTPNCFKKNEFDCSKPNRARHIAGRYCYA